MREVHELTQHRAPLRVPSVTVAGSNANEEGLHALGREITGKAPRRARGKKGNRKRPRRHRWLVRVAITLGAVIVLVVAAGAAFGWYENHRIHRISVGGLNPDLTSGLAAGTENILMVGSTTRCGLAHQSKAYGLCTQGVTGVNSDVVMVLHLNMNTKEVSVLSIPRDLFIPNARSTGAYKIDAALAQGPTQLVAAIEEDFAIPIQHYVELTFDSFAAVVTALGGITMDFPVRVFDRESGLHVLQTGCHHLDGVQALQVVRARHLQYWVPGDATTVPYTWPQEGESDLARIRRDHEFLRVLATKVASHGLSNPASDLSLIDALAPHLTVDSGLSASHMVSLVLAFHHVNVNHAPQMTIPVDIDTFGTYVYQGTGFGDVEFPTEPLDHAVVDRALGLGPGDNTMTGQPLPAPGAVTVSVLNGTGQTGQATATSKALAHLGFHVLGTGNTTPVGQYAETTVSYAHRSVADQAAAQLVADSLSGQVVLRYGKTSGGAQVTVTTGTNFSVNSSLPGASPSAPSSAPSAEKSTTPTSAVSSSSTPSSVPTATSAAATSPSGFAAPSEAVQALEPWDPRACPAGAVGNRGNW